MSDIPVDFRYSKTHEWLRTDEDGSITMGITDHAQSLLGDIVFVELPEAEIAITSGQECGVVESVKAASDLYAPISGDIVAINEALIDSPELINTDPYGEGWIIRIEGFDEGELDELLDADGYKEHVAAEAH